MAQVIQESGPRQPGESGSFYDFLESCLRHKNDMVTVEAARAICNMKDVTTRELTPAVTVLQLMLSSSKPVIRSAGLPTMRLPCAAMSDPCTCLCPVTAQQIAQVVLLVSVWCVYHELRLKHTLKCYPEDCNLLWQQSLASLCMVVNEMSVIAL